MRGNDPMKKIVMVTTAAFLLLFLVYQGSMAFFHAETQVGANISAGSLGIELVQDSQDEKAVKTEDGIQIASVMPGDEIDSSAYIKNVKDHTLYVRVTATKYWEDATGTKLPDADASLIALNTKDTKNWIIKDDAENSNSENVYFYYRLPIKANEISTNLMDAIKISSKLSDETYHDYRIVLTLEVDAVQSISGTDAVLSEWGADIELDADGNILSVDD